ncbi:MAG TPA: MaoC family dehydratase [Xanthobacteraceae bacterium]|nr:MaoC family dehydratase [Xanthobacteraceae bacterium]
MPPHAPPPKRYWEDFAPGQVIEHGPRRITREEIVAYAREFDPQPFHLDEEAARHSMLGGLCASGWHSCCILMRMSAESFVLNSSSMGAPGVDEVRWLAPIRPGDDLTLRATVLSSRPSGSRPGMGLVNVHFELFNASGVCVLSLKAPLMFARRNSGIAA